MKHYLFLLSILLVFRSGATNPVSEFCTNNNILSKSVLIAVTPDDCGSCMRPIDKLLSKIVRINKNIRIYIITSEALSEMEKGLFQNKLGVQTFKIEYISDKNVHDYIVSEKQGVPSICCVNEASILCIKNLKDDDLEALYVQIAQEFEINIVKTLELKNKFISSYRAAGNCYVTLGNNLYAFYRQYNLLSQYDERGANTKNVFVDSLKINYLELAKALFSSADYKSTSFHLEHLKKPKKRALLIAPKSLVRIGADTLALAANISCFKDTIYKNQDGTFETEYCCLLLFNKDLKFIGHLKFNSTDAKIIEPHCQIATLGSSLYLAKYNVEKDNFYLAEYKVKMDSLQLISQIEEPHRTKEGDVLQTICPHNSQNCVFMTYNADKDKNVNIYKFDISSHSFTKVIQADDLHILGTTVYQTKKGNYIFLANKPKNTLSVYGYDSRKKKFVNPSNPVSDKAVNEGVTTFKIGLNNDLVEVSYTE
jgi:hypothetical protein